MAAVTDEQQRQVCHPLSLFLPRSWPRFLPSPCVASPSLCPSDPAEPAALFLHARLLIVPHSSFSKRTIMRIESPHRWAESVCFLLLCYIEPIRGGEVRIITLWCSGMGSLWEEILSKPRCPPLPDLYFRSLYTCHTCVVNCFLLPSSVPTELVFRYREAMLSYLEISSVVLIPVPFCTLLQGDEYEPSEVGRAGCSQSHWVEANHQECQENRKARDCDSLRNAPDNVSESGELKATE